MLRFVLRKMVNKKWMVLSLLLGNILLVSIACANAMYSDAMLERTLRQNLSAALTEDNVYPGLIEVSVERARGRTEQTLQAARTVREMPQSFGIHAAEAVEHYVVGPYRTESELNREKGMAETLSIGMLSDLEEHVRLISGRMYSDEIGEDGVIDVIVSERGMAQMNLLMGECFSLTNLPQGEDMRFRLCGVFANSREQDAYWVKSPDALTRECLMSPALFESLFLKADASVQLGADFYMMLDYTAISPDKVDHMLEKAEYYREHFYRIEGQFCRNSFSEILKSFLQTSEQVSVMLWVLQVPVFMLLALFVFMVSSQMLDGEQNEISLFKSRGASRAQIIGMYVLQSGLIAGAAFGAGVPLGKYLVQVLGSANGFLEFVQRARLNVEIDASALWTGGAAALFSMGTMVLPIVRRSRVDIVAHKRSRQRQSDAPLWQKLFLDVLLIAAALYILYGYSAREITVIRDSSLDPLIFMASSMFMVGTGLFALRVIPFVTKIVFRVFRKWWSPAMYAALLQVTRTRRAQSFITVFLVVTMALGVFNAQTARSINDGGEDAIRYSIGADIVFAEKWQTLGGGDEAEGGEPVYVEPDFGRWEELEGASSVTRVLNIKNGSMAVTGGMLRNIQIMGIHTKQFGETAWMRDDLLMHHFYEYLNAMAVNSHAVILSSNFRSNYGYELGDAIRYQNAAGDSVQGVVCGFVDYWPAYQPRTLTQKADGTYAENENYLIVAHLSYLQDAWGVMPYEVWMNAEDSTRFVYDYAQENGVYFTSFADASERLIRMKNDPVFQGTNGILTVSFVVVLTLCAAGFLMYWILSIRARSLQFGIYRAMGMTMREIWGMLIGEQVLISGLSAGVGVLSGYLTSRLYMPLIQTAYTAYDNMLPLRMTGSAEDMARLVLCVGAVMVVCLLILGRLIAKMNITQALKLGED